MSTDFLFAIDNSGSTGRKSDYWNKVLSLTKPYPTAQYLFWDTDVKKVSYDQVMSQCRSMSGGGGTQPQCIVKLLPADTKKTNLVLITDGEVMASDVASCDAVLNGRSFASVDVHFISTGGQMNLTVSAPFTRNADKVKINVGDEVLATGSTTQAIDLKKYYGKPEEFMNDAEAILKQVVLQSLGKNNQALRNEFLELQKNLLATLAKNNSAGGEYGKLRDLLKTGNYDSAITMIKSLVLNADSSVGKKIEAVIQELINQCSGSSNFSFDLLQPGRLARAMPVKAVATEELPEEENHTKFECPILLDDGSVPVLCIKQGAPVFEGLEKNYLDSLMTSPLMMLDNPELVQKLVGRLDHLVSLAAFKELLKQSALVKSPITRDPISSIVSVGNEKTHLKATNFALADLFFGKKLVGQPELWLAVLYFALQKVEYLRENKEFMGAFVKSMVQRMETKNTNITLTGLPVDPLIKAPIDIAVWYCVVSPHVVQNTSPVDDARNRLRSFGNAAKYLIELVELYGYPYDKTWTLHQMKRYKAFWWMMKEEKDHSDWRMKLRAQWQNSLTLSDGTLIMLDGAPSDKKPPLPNFELPLEEFVALSKLVDQNKKTNDVAIPSKLDLTTPPFVTNYCYPDNLSDEDALSPTPICPNTYRPYTVDRKQKLHWKTCTEKRWGPLDKQISNYNYFIRYVHEMDKYPTQEEFIKYTASKQANRESNAMDTLPKKHSLFVKKLFEDFEDVLGKNFANVTPHDFKVRTYQSMREVDRLQMDSSDGTPVFGADFKNHPVNNFAVCKCDD